MSGGAPPDFLGKDEVASSNLASSSKKSVIPSGMADFLELRRFELAKPVRIWGARGALPVAGGATRASGRGLCATQAHRRQGAHRAPQTGLGLPRRPKGEAT